MKVTSRAKFAVILLCLVFAGRAGAAVPAAPTMLSVVPDYATNEMRLTWQDNAGDETGYRVERTTGGGYATVDNLAANVQNYTDTTVVAGVEYTYRIAAHNADGDAFSDEVNSSIAITWTLSNGNHEMMHGFQDGTPRNNWGFHEGIDVQADGQGGQEVVAVRGGIINYSANGIPCPGDNVAIEVRQGAQIFTDLYCHMQNPTGKVVGESVAPGEKIGEISTTAYSAGRRHVHQMLIDGGYALPNSGNTFRNPYSIFTLAADRDPLGTIPGLEDVGGDGNLILYKRPDNSYFTTAGIHGDVDISAEITDAQGTAPRVGVLRAGYWIGGGPPGSESVRDSATPYLLHDFDGWFGQAPPTTGNFDAIYDPDQEWTSGAFRKRFHHLLTNTRGTDGSVANLDATQIWRTDARKGSGTEPNGSDAGRARENQDARFPDGTYFVHVVADDMLNRNDRSEPVLLDNSRPYVRRVSVFSGARIVYRAEWVWNGAATSLALQPATFDAAAPFTALRTQDITIEVEFSEPMATASITAITPDGGAGDLGVTPTLASTEPAHARLVWRGLISNLDINDDGTHDGTHMLTIDGTDLAGNALLEIDTRVAMGADHHNRDGTGALRGTVGTDTIHGFRIGPLSGVIPVTAIFMKQDAADPPAPTKEDRALTLQTALNDYFDEVSYDEISFAVTAHGWYELDQALNWYETSPRTPLVDLVQEAITHAETDGVEIGDYVLVVTDENVTRPEWSTHEAWPYTVVTDPGWRLIASGTLNAATTEARLTNLAGRMVGLIDLFRYPEVSYTGGEFVGPWSHMSAQDDNVHVLGWEKWRVGWLDETGTTTGKTLTRVPKPPVATPIAGEPYTISAMDSDTDAVKMVAIEIGDRLHYTVEYRRQQNLDAALPDEGVVILKANDYINFGEGPAIIQESNISAGNLNDAPFNTTAPRDVFNDVGSGVTVSVVSINATEASISLDYAVPPTENDVFVDPHDRWKTDDIWVDAPDKITGEFEVDPLATIDADELPVPGQVNKVYGRVRNQGHADATNFELHLEIHDPWGTGGPWTPLNVKTVAFLQGRGTDPAGDAYDIVEGEWTPSGDPHACAKLSILGVANDAVTENNWTQENFSQFDATGDSPYGPVTTRFDVENPYDESIIVFFKLDGVPPSWTYTLSPERLTIPARGLGDAVVTLHPHEGAPVCSKEIVTVSAYTPRVDTLKELGGITLQIGMKNAASVDSESWVQCGSGDPVVVEKLSYRDTIFNTRSCDIHTQGCTDPAQPNTQVPILYTRPDGSTEVRYVTTDGNGCFTDTITDADAGRWETEVIIDGDDCTEDTAAPPTSVDVPPSLCGGAIWCCWLWLAVLIALIAALLWLARWRCGKEKAILPFFITLAVTLFLGWLLLSYCAINLVLFWFSIGFAIIIALMLMCWLPFVPCIGRGSN